MRPLAPLHHPNGPDRWKPRISDATAEIIVAPVAESPIVSQRPGVDPLLTLEPDRLTVDPGGEVRATLTVRNPGDLVEQYRLQVLGEAFGWTQLVPREVSIVPGKEDAAGKTVQVVFRPPPA